MMQLSTGLFLYVKPVRSGWSNPQSRQPGHLPILNLAAVCRHAHPSRHTRKEDKLSDGCRGNRETEGT